MTPASKVLLVPDVLVGGVRVISRMMSSCLPSLEVFLKGAVASGVVCKPGKQGAGMTKGVTVIAIDVN